LVLSNTKPKTLTKGSNAGKPSKAKFVTDEAALEEARKRVKALLDKYPVYPELDLQLLKQQFCS